MVLIQLYDSYGVQSEILIFEGLAKTCAIISWINESSLPITTTSFEKDPETDLAPHSLARSYVFPIATPLNSYSSNNYHFRTENQVVTPSQEYDFTRHVTSLLRMPEPVLTTASDSRFQYGLRLPASEEPCFNSWP